MIRFVVFIVAWLLGVGVQSSVVQSSITDVIKNNETKEMQSIDATVFVFAYRLMKESEKIFQPMITSPQQTMQSLCGFPVAHSRQLIYQYAAFYDTVLVQNIMAFSKELSLNGTKREGVMTVQILEHLHTHRKLMEKAHILNLSADVVEAFLIDESLKIDILLSKFGADIAALVFDTFHEGDMKQLKNMSEDIKQGLREKCGPDSDLEEQFSEVL
ncbi:hypothetical protein [Bartonella bovis]|uniref:Uncharacterized protein n=1 Tax=Bartonella bovis 91-4 TaxID=1094491 RepID=N6VAN8_9HYPH|nr:hypothetical protein [Bartonella bovis]ENN90321.1 hypothetical protein BBbe_12390 [Bartonella bovis 91-4]